LTALWQIVQSSQVPKAGCEKCKEGYIAIPKTEGIGFNYTACDCLIERESLLYSQKLLQEANIPERFRTQFRIENWQEDRKLTFNFIEDYIENDKECGKNWLFIDGAAGTGKTFASILIAQIALLKERSVYFTNVTNLLDDLRPEGKGPEVLERCSAVDLLILDDIGHEKSSVWVRERLYRIVNDRWSEGKMTIFTSNFSVENLKDTISEAVYSRVKGDATCIHLTAISDRRINS
jgi:DNA replication protein DnaC